MAVEDAAEVAEGEGVEEGGTLDTGTQGSTPKQGASDKKRPLCANCPHLAGVRASARITIIE
ncbi:MAG: hypothetical protein KA216_11900, partial [Giesbergeria sp.]|nr:hypothetical protein [Giesbergeria sp.]